MTAVDRVAELIQERNRIDAELSSCIGRPALTGHLGEWIAAQVFGIELETSKGVNGRFRGGRTVDVKWYPKREGLLDLKEEGPDLYLVLAGPKSAAASSRGTTRPLVIDAMYLFDAAAIVADLRARGRRIGTASSVRTELWEAAEIYPRRHPLFFLSDEQREMLASFGS
ncbi:hypothetical protein [Lentzea flaviverrucosa]|uniref:Uncharacterized protein n=1 Tax=Lentzea flaviverrucosa TaxID=200379 RepID=A0A1H9VTC4_9PSEU|nr:hypothetical protein [Lentzea flaviverrucosa]RDI23633.1 hypothetical protein DFR72_11038 [Lentzea flaviverrucosa]SES25070.1 hypothetical protein SAMN05216195_110297 [Lentzea flaviverrucosa]